MDLFLYFGVISLFIKHNNPVWNGRFESEGHDAIFVQKGVSRLDSCICFKRNKEVTFDPDVKDESGLFLAYYRHEVSCVSLCECFATEKEGWTTPEESDATTPNEAEETMTLAEALVAVPNPMSWLWTAEFHVEICTCFAYEQKRRLLKRRIFKRRIFTSICFETAECHVKICKCFLYKQKRRLFT